MKRSEMIEILRESFIRHMNPPEPCCNNDEEMYSHILQDIENKGMTPPIINEKSWTMSPDGLLTYAVHEWEKE